MTRRVASEVRFSRGVPLCNQMDLNEGIYNADRDGARDDRSVFVRAVRPFVGRSDGVEFTHAGRKRERLEGEGEIDATAFFIHAAIHATGVICITHAHAERDGAVLHGRF